MEISSSPTFLILDAQGNSTQQEIHAFPCRIGRHSSNDVIIRDARASRNHAQLTIDNGDFVLEDLQSRHGVYVNGDRVTRQVLRDGDRVEFGFPDSFSLVFERSGSRVAEIADQLTNVDLTGVPLTDVPLTNASGTGGNLARLRAVLEIARSLQNSFSVDSVLAAVIDAALVVTNAERGFLLLNEAGELNVRCARDRQGPLRDSDLAVPRNLIRKALDERSSTFSMQFHPDRTDPSASVAALELKSVVCIPLVRIRVPGETVGVLYMDSRTQPHDMAAGNRELLETLGLEASTVLENARLLAEDRARQHLEEELAVARNIQQSLLPNDLPETGWLRAAGYSMPSRHVGGDYYDLIRVDAACACAIVADVSGKGVSSALVASLLQGAFLAIDENPQSLRHTLDRVNAFFQQRTENEKHATIFCALIHSDGRLEYINAGHCAPIIVPLNDVPETLAATAPPVGLLDNPDFAIAQVQLEPFDRLVIFTDGVTEAQNPQGEYFGSQRLRDVIRTHGDRPSSLLHQALLDAVESFTGGQEQADDLTLVVLEYRPD